MLLSSYSSRGEVLRLRTTERSRVISTFYRAAQRLRRRCSILPVTVLNLHGRGAQSQAEYSDCTSLTTSLSRRKKAAEQNCFRRNSYFCSLCHPHPLNWQFGKLLPFDEKLYYTDDIRRTRSNRFAESMVCLWKQGERFSVEISEKAL